MGERFPSYCCQTCGEPVGWIGRFFAWIVGPSFHGCKGAPKPWLIDREGTVYKPERRVVLKASPKD